MAQTLQLCLATLLLFGVISSFHFKVVAAKPTLSVKGESAILQESILQSINENPRAGWKASLNPRFSNYTVDQFKHLLGVIPTPWGELKSIPVMVHSKSLTLPEQFDLRTAWPQCSTLREILACCGFLCGAGCNGGYPISAWRYFVHSGVVTEECDPYFDQTGCSHPGCEPGYPTPKCRRKCNDGNHRLWKQAKHYSVSAYRVKSDPQNIMDEVYKNGPVEVAFTVYEDFAHYKSGVYKHVTGSKMGGHAVKLIGWGTTDEGEEYWLLANQWNRSWGDDGYFKIRRGTNECGIEEDVVAGLPSSKNLIRDFGNADAFLDRVI